MNQDEIREILRKHALWLDDPAGGERADLRGASLIDANLRGANLRDADLSGANLRGANLSDANLYDADLYDADLSGANLRGADLRGADLSDANLGGADLRGADLRGANLRYANLIGADLSDANLGGADLRGANLRGADLRGANLYDADLRGADLSDAVWDHSTVGIHPAPEGELIVWGQKGRRIVKMRVPAEARRSCATTRKMRAEYVDVLEVEGAEEAVVNNEYGKTVYRPGERVHCHEWCEDRWQECAGGIHFFLTREEAEQW